MSDRKYGDSVVKVRISTVKHRNILNHGNLF